MSTHTLPTLATLENNCPLCCKRCDRFSENTPLENACRYRDETFRAMFKAQHFSTTKSAQIQDICVCAVYSFIHCLLGMPSSAEAPQPCTTWQPAARKAIRTAAKAFPPRLAIGLPLRMRLQQPTTCTRSSSRISCENNSEILLSTDMCAEMHIDCRYLGHSSAQLPKYATSFSRSL